MREDIKERVKLIKCGKVPRGYRKSKIGIVPEDWVDTKFEVLFEEKGERTNDIDKFPLYSLTLEEGIVEKSERYDREHLVKKGDSAYKVVHPNEFAYNPMNIRFGAVARNKTGKSVSVSGYYDIFEVKENSDRVFVESFLIGHSMIKYYNTVCTGSLDEKKRVHFSDFMLFNVPLPSKNERKIISKLLAVYDEKIRLLGKQIKETKDKKKWLAHNLMTGNRRLSGFSGEWNKIKLSKVFCERKEYASKTQGYEHVTLAKEGIFPKSERYDRNHLVKKEEKEYKVTHLGDICYNPANLKFGVICRNIYGDAMFSPIYVTFEVNKGYDVEFVSQYITRWNFINAVRKYEEGTVYERMAVKPEDFLKFEVYFPKTEEQRAIARILSNVDKEISLLKSKLELIKKEKKAIMQLLLSGIVRVNEI